MSQFMIEIIYPTSDAVFYVERQPPAGRALRELLPKDS